MKEATTYPPSWRCGRAGRYCARQACITSGAFMTIGAICSMAVVSVIATLTFPTWQPKARIEPLNPPAEKQAILPTSVFDEAGFADERRSLPRRAHAPGQTHPQIHAFGRDHRQTHRQNAAAVV